ncbi:MAG: hypothetical protein QOI05_2246 [Bradyrhizobium sp.]|jgi:hypothetical protein|nr:hypothetical protein [Bradyrhizobium sp.]
MLTVRRSGYRDDSYWTRKEYKAGIGADFLEEGKPGRVRIAFATNPEGLRKQSYSVTIRPDDFETVAREMMKADPEKAIRAFGAAMQDFERPKPIL